MTMKILLPLILCLFVSASYGQSEAPEKGTLADLRGKTKFFLVFFDLTSPKVILKEVKRQKVFTAVDYGRDAEFFIEYRMTLRATGGLIGATGMIRKTEVGNMTVFFYRGDTRVIVWSEQSVWAEHGESKIVDSALHLIDKFLNDVKNDQKGKN